MEITTTTIHDLTWDFPDANEFNATITNGKITELHFKDVGDLTMNDLSSTNEKYLRNIHKALTGLFQHLDEIRNVGNLHIDEDRDDDNFIRPTFSEAMKSIDHHRHSKEEINGKLSFVK